MVEIIIAVGILALLMGLAWLPYANYRAHTAVNNSWELFQTMAQRAIETAKASGYPLPAQMKVDGLSDAALARPPGSQLWIRIRSRRQAGATPEIVANRRLTEHASLNLRLQGLGRVELENQTDLRGLFLEVVSRDSAGANLVLAVLPIDVNGEFVLLAGAGSARLDFAIEDYVKSWELSLTGVISSP